MNLKSISLFLGLILFCSVYAFADTAVYELDSESSRLTFYGDTPLHKFEGSTRSLTGQLRADTQALVVERGAEVHVAVASFLTGDEGRDQAVHYTLKSKTQPEAVFRLDEVLPAGSDRFHVKGSLLLAGIEKKLEFDAAVVVTADSIEIDAEIPLGLSMFKLSIPPLARLIGVRDSVPVKFHTRWLRRT